MGRPRTDPTVEARVISYCMAGYSDSVILKTLKKDNIKIGKGTLWKIKKRATNPPENKENVDPKSRRPHVLSTRKLKTLEKMAKDPNPPSQRHMAKVLKVSQSTISRGINEKLRLKKRIKPKVHHLTCHNIESRRTRSLALYKRLANGRWKKYITTDEAWFYLSNGNGKRRIQYVSRDEHKPKVEVFQRHESHSKGVMVWAGISSRGKTSLHFIEPGAKINSTYYQEKVLKPFLKKDAKRLFPQGDFIFHQDSAPSHVSRSTVAFMTGKMEFIPKEEWLPKSPDAAPMDYFVWGYLKRWLWKKDINTIDELKRALQTAWRILPQKLIIKALESWPKRIYQIYKAKGQHIEK